MMAFKCFDDHDNEVGFENRDFNLNPCPHNIALTLQCSGVLTKGVLGKNLELGEGDTWRVIGRSNLESA